MLSKEEMLFTTTFDFCKHSFAHIESLTIIISGGCTDDGSHIAKAKKFVEVLRFQSFHSLRINFMLFFNGFMARKVRIINRLPELN